MPKDSTSKLSEYGSRFGMPIAVGLCVVFLIVLILVNIPPIPLPFTDNKFYLINQVFAEQFKFYGYSLLYFVLIYFIYRLFNTVFKLVTSNYKVFYKKFQRLLEKII